MKKLNDLRNNVAHVLCHVTTEEDVESLFVGNLGGRRENVVVNGDVWAKLSSYKAMIYAQMLKPEVLK